ncbi:alpha-ribazole phosphatase family protein [Candidatus Reidiella endopervernicosa]|nr:alpha-ribazole phosphatase family protein [Candidatus Reidiella endopervernicosa]
MVTTTIDLMRHGEPVGGRRYRGQIDDPLSEKGWRQMREAVADHAPWDRIVSSSLSRCSEFAAELASRHGIPMKLDPRLMEIGFGEWEGRTAAELMAEDSETLNRFWSDPLNNTPPGAETLADFRDRVIAAWESLLNSYAGQHLLVVGHAGMMRMVLRHVLDMPLDRMFRLQVPSAGISRVQVDHFDAESFPRLIFHAGQL